MVLLPMLSLGQDVQPKKATQPEAKVAKKVAMGLQPDLLRGPYLQIATANGITVRWRTSTFDRSRVKYGTSPGQLNQHTDDSTLVAEHIVRLEGLKPRTKYYYSIGNLADTTLQGDAANYFYTLPEKGYDGLVRIGAFGDCGNNSLNQRNVKREALAYIKDKPMDAWILLGDNAYSDGTDAEFQSKFFNIYKDDLLKNYPLFPSPGNHDYHDFNSSSAKDQYKIAYFQNFSVPKDGEAGGVASKTKSFYSFDVGNVHFLSLDSYGPDNTGKHIYDTMGEQAEWVKKDLKENKSKWVVAYWHHPPYTMGSHNSDTETLLVKIRENFIKILEDEGVDLILCGHSHVYERSKLLKGYYGMEADFNAEKFELNHSTALYDGTKNSAPYLKKSADNKGTVYVVSGSAGALGGHKETWPHNAMYYANNEVGGSVMIEAEGNRFNLKWVCADGKIRDSFTIMKDVSKAQEKILNQDKMLK